MTLRAAFLDSGPLGLATLPVGARRAAGFRSWLADLEAAGVQIVVPEVADFETRRELVRAGLVASVSRLDAFAAYDADRYLAVSTDAWRLAANIRAQSRNAGIPTADRHALDGDVILAAQALTSRFVVTDIVVASVNMRHLSRYVPAKRWEDITP